MLEPFALKILSLAWLLPMLAACGSSDDDVGTLSDDSTTLINTPVLAGVGGSFTSTEGLITVRIPAEAITEDSTLVITEVEGLTNARENQSGAGNAFDIDFGTTLAAPAELELVTQQIPQHPELANQQQS